MTTATTHCKVGTGCVQPVTGGYWNEGGHWVTYCATHEAQATGKPEPTNYYAQDSHGLPLRREGEALDAWQERAMETAAGWTRCLAITTKGTLCVRQAAACHSHTPA